MFDIKQEQCQCGFINQAANYKDANMLEEARDFIKTHPRVRILLLLLAILIASPIAMELLIFLQYGGIEVAFLCMIATFKPYLAKINQYKQRLILFFKISKAAIFEHQITQPRVFVANSAVSTIFIFITGNFALSLTGWLVSFALLR